MNFKYSRTRTLAVLIVGVSVVLAFASSLDDSPVVDEVPHIGAAYSYIQRGDMRLNPEHPPLVKDIAGVALLTLGLHDDVFRGPEWTDNVNDQWNFGRKLIFGSGNNADMVKTVARLPMLLFLLLGSWLVWKWSYERGGDTAALLAVTLFSFSPTIMAHTRLVTTDMAAAVGTIAATYCFMRLLRQQTRRNFIWAAVVLGLALLTKFNTVLLGPYFLVIALLYGLDGHWVGRRAWQRALRNVGLTVLVGLTAFIAVVWPVYVLHTMNYPAQRQVSDTRTIMEWQPDSIYKKAALWAADKPLFRAAGHYVTGLAMVIQRSQGGNNIYWLGRVVNAGGPWYFPIVYFLKEPLAWWLLVSMAITASAFRRRRHANEPVQGSWWTRDAEEWVWLLWLAIYWMVSIRSTLNIGIRHLLPVYPFAIILVSSHLSVLIDWLRAHDHKRYIYFSWSIAALLGWYAFESVNVFPYYLTYFNQVAGGPSGGFRYVVDSNLDWGQDGKRLAQYVQAQGIQRIAVDYFGWADLNYYLPGGYVWTSIGQYRDATDFIRRNTTNGWLAVSGTFLQNSNGEKTRADNSDLNTYRWLLDYEPVTVIGNSIFVYHLTK